MTDGSDSGPWITGPPPPPPDPDDNPTEAMPHPPGFTPSPTPDGSWDWGERVRTMVGRARGVAPHLQTESLFLVGAASVLVAYVFGWLDSILTAVRHAPGLSAQDRAFELFSVGAVDWAAFLLLGTGLVAVARRIEVHVSRQPEEAIITGLLVATALTVAAALFGVLVELTNFGHGIDAAFTGIVARLAALPVGAAAGWWAWRLRGERFPV